MTKRVLACLAGAFAFLVIGMGSCNSADTTSEETAEAARVPEPAVEPASEPAPVTPSNPMLESQPAVPEPSVSASEPSPQQVWEQTAWVAGKEGKLIQGLDGGEYDPYSVDTIQQVQQALQSAGIYSGPTSGLLDQATMQAIGEFQKNHGLQVCGVPTPNTRELLLEP
jgi:Putative peptidoglycan binding domain